MQRAEVARVATLVFGAPIEATDVIGETLERATPEPDLNDAAFCHALTDRLMGKVERMSALAVFIGLLLWTWIWGAWGTVLAVPMLVIIKSTADHVPQLRSLGRLMAP
jgi:hypothetical protein